MELTERAFCRREGHDRCDCGRHGGIEVPGNTEAAMEEMVSPGMYSHQGSTTHLGFGCVLLRWRRSVASVSKLYGEWKMKESLGGGER